MSNNYIVNVLTSEYNPSIPATDSEDFKKAYAASPCHKKINESNVTDIIVNRMYSSKLVELSSFGDLATLLTELDKQAFKCIIHGRLKKSLQENIPYRRDLETYHDIPRNVVMFDIDNAKYPPNINVLDNPQECAEFVRDMFPDLQYVNCVVTFSSSAHIKLTDVKAHIWFLCERPYSYEELENYATALRVTDGVVIDSAVFRTVQPNYTASPLVIGGDPIKNRVIVLDGEESDTADLDIPTIETMQTISCFIESPDIDAEENKNSAYINTKRGKKHLLYKPNFVAKAKINDDIKAFLQGLSAQESIADNVGKAAMYIHWGLKGIDKDLFFEAMQQHPRNVGKEKKRFSKKSLLGHLERCLSSLRANNTNFKTAVTINNSTSEINTIKGLRAAYNFLPYDKDNAANTITKTQLKKLLLTGEPKKEHAQQLINYLLHYFYNINNKVGAYPQYLSNSDIKIIQKKLPSAAKQLANGIQKFWELKEELRTGLDLSNTPRLESENSRSGITPSILLEEYKQQYLPKIDPILRKFDQYCLQPKQRLLVLADGMGSGKTTQLASLVKQHPLKTCVVLNPQIVLSRNLADKMDLDCYLDCKEGVNSSHRLVSTIHSAHKIDLLHNDERELDILILEEFTGIMSALHSGVIKGKAKQENTWASLINAVKKAKIIILSDANITKADIDIVNEIREATNNCLIVKRVAQEKKKQPVTVFMGKSLKGVTQQGALEFKELETSRNGVRFISAGNRSPEYCDRLVAMINATWCANFQEGHPRHDEKPRILCVHKDNDGDYQEFFKNPDIALNYDIFIYTPKITSGVSIKDKIISVPDITKQQPTHFAHAFFNFINIGMKSSDCMQMLGRYRNDCPITIFIQTVDKKLPININDIADNQTKVIRQTLQVLAQNPTLISKYDEPLLHEPTGYHSANSLCEIKDVFLKAEQDYKQALLSKPNQLGLKDISEANRDQNEFADRILTMLHTRFQYILLADDANRCLLVDYKDGVQAQILEGVRTAKKLTDDQYTAIKLHPTRKRADSYAMTRYNIKKYFFVEDVCTPCNLTAFNTKKKSLESYYDLYNDERAMRVYSSVGVIARHDKSLHFDNNIEYKKTGKSVQNKLILLLWKGIFLDFTDTKAKKRAGGSRDIDLILKFSSENLEALKLPFKFSNDRTFIKLLYMHFFNLSFSFGLQIKSIEKKHLTEFLKLQKIRGDSPQ